MLRSYVSADLPLLITPATVPHPLSGSPGIDSYNSTPCNQQTMPGPRVQAVKALLYTRTSLTDRETASKMGEAQVT